MEFKLHIALSKDVVYYILVLTSPHSHTHAKVALESLVVYHDLSMKFDKLGVR